MKFRIKSAMIDELSHQDKKDLLEGFYELSKRNLKIITKAYIEERFKKYKIISFLKKENQFIAFSFSHMRSVSFVFFRIPLFHYGLTVVDKPFRKQKVSVSIARSVYALLVSKKKFSHFSCWCFGFFYTAKCSSPVSFLKVKDFTLSWPRIKNEDSLSYLSKTSLSVKLSRFLSQLVSGQKTDNYIIKNINKDSDFFLEEEEYVFHSKKDKIVVQFFKKHIQPCHEIITIAWFHPLFFYLQKEWYASGSD